MKPENKKYKHKEGKQPATSTIPPNIAQTPLPFFPLMQMLR